MSVFLSLSTCINVFCKKVVMHPSAFLKLLTKEHSGRLWCWVDKMREFQYVVKHIPGNKNKVADAFSLIGIIGTEKWSVEYVRQQQDECQVISQTKGCLKLKLSSVKTTDSKVKPFEKELSRCFIRNDGVLAST